MVVKRQCSFCAAEIEPGTGAMFVKRDGTVFHFCSSSCRKQQLHLHRVGHRFKWTRAHALKRAADHSSAQARAEAAKSAAPPAAHRRTRATPKAAETPAPPPAVDAAAPAAPAESPPGSAEPAPSPAKKPRARKKKAEPSDGSS